MPLVCRHDWQAHLACRLTQRWEASLWLSGKQLYLGGFEREEDAARAYDIAALACKGPMVATNFDASEYTKELEAVRGCSKVRPSAPPRPPSFHY